MGSVEHLFGANSLFVGQREIGRELGMSWAGARWYVSEIGGIRVVNGPGPRQWLVARADWERLRATLPPRPAPAPKRKARRRQKGVA